MDKCNCNSDKKDEKNQEWMHSENNMDPSCGDPCAHACKVIESINTGFKILDKVMDCKSHQTSEKEKHFEPPKDEFTELDEIYAINSTTGDIYAHRGGSGELIRRIIDNHSDKIKGESNAITPDGTHYFLLNEDGKNKVYRQKEGGAKEYVQEFDTFNIIGMGVRKDGVGFNLQSNDGTTLYKFKQSEKTYTTVKVNYDSTDTRKTNARDITFDEDNRAYILNFDGIIWRVDNTDSDNWQAKYLTQISYHDSDGNEYKYSGMAFDTKGNVYLACRLDKNGQTKYIIAKSRFESPDKVEKVYDRGWGITNEYYSDLASRAYPKLP